MTPWLPGFEDFRLDRALRIYVAALVKRVESVSRVRQPVEIGFGEGKNWLSGWRLNIDGETKAFAPTFEELIPKVEQFLTAEAYREDNDERRVEHLAQERTKTA